MAFLAPIIGGALGLGAVGTALVGVGLSLALGAAARALAPKPKAAGPAGVRLSLRYDASAEREIIFGEAATAGTIVYQNLYGPNGADYVQLVFALADHECHSLTKFWVNGTAVTWNSSDGTVSEFPGVMWVRFKSGAYDQTADSELVAQSRGKWTTDDRGRGVCYVVVTMKYDEKLYPSGIPRFLFQVKGAKLYDWRKDTTAGGSGAHRWGQPATYEWTDNPIVCAFNYRRGLWLNGQRIAGMNTPLVALPLADWTEAANACDEAVPDTISTTRKRYRVNGVVSTGEVHRETLRDIMSSTAGAEIDTGGVLKPRPGVARAPVAAFTDDDLARGGDVDVTPKRSRSQLVNAIFGTWNDPARTWERVSAPPRVSPTDEAADGGVRLEQSFDLSYVSDGHQAQSILETLRRDARHQLTARVRLRAGFAAIEAGDWVTWTSARYGFVAQLFRVEHATVATDQSVVLALREASNGIYTVTLADYLNDNAPATVGAGGPTVPTVASLSVVTVTVDGGGGTVRPGLRITYTPITSADCIGIDIEYRVAGDTVALTRRIQDPSAGQYTWLDGVMGQVVYEVRARPVTNPATATAWTGWVSTAGNTASVIAGTTGVTIPPDTITREQLDPQTRFELSLASMGEGVTGSVQQIRDDMLSVLQTLAENDIASQIDGYETRALVRTETTERVTATSALAQQMTTVSTRLDDAEATITIQATSINGLAAQYVLGLDVGGRISGVKLAGSATVTDLLFLVDNLKMAAPGYAGGAAVPLFSVETVMVSGTPTARLFLNGDIYAKSVSTASLSAISSNFGDATFTGVLRSAANDMIIDFNAKRFRILATA